MPQSMAQKFRVETKSEIKPYVVRDHAWSIVQHDEMNAREYQEDAPDGYNERMDYEAEPYNKPVDKSSTTATAVQESTPGDKKVTVVQHTEHKEAAKELHKEIKKEKKEKKEEAKKEAKKEEKKEAKKDEKKISPKKEVAKSPKLVETAKKETKKAQAVVDKKVPADHFDKHDKGSKLKDNSKEAAKEEKKDKKDAKELKKEKKAEKNEKLLEKK
jgi:hypothetical protein